MLSSPTFASFFRGRSLFSPKQLLTNRIRLWFSSTVFTARRLTGRTPILQQYLSAAIPVLRSFPDCSRQTRHGLENHVSEKSRSCAGSCFRETAIWEMWSAPLGVLSATRRKLPVHENCSRFIVITNSNDPSHVRKTRVLRK